MPQYTAAGKPDFHTSGDGAGWRRTIVRNEDLEISCDSTHHFDIPVNLPDGG